jgi:mono/diheme cytochrome c family protein
MQLDRMMDQPRVDPLDEGARVPPPYTVARGRGPKPRPAVTRALIEEGGRAYDQTCAACHGVRGDGESVVATKMMLRRPPSLGEARVRGLTDDQIHDVIAQGYGLMPSYAPHLSFDETWGVVAYVRALQMAQGVAVASLPASMRAELAREAP